MRINYLAELEPYMDRFDKWSMRGNKFIATSPFRVESHPSFAINLDTGVYIDSGLTYSKIAKGNFIKLLSYLSGETYNETKMYLEGKYNIIYGDISALNLKLDIKYTLEEKRPYMDEYELTEGNVDKCTYSNYMLNRGVSVKVQQMFKIKEQLNVVHMPVFNVRGALVNVKYRHTKVKRYWSDSKGLAIKQYVYGAHLIKNCKTVHTVHIVEGEIDCLTLWSWGYFAVATFGAKVTKRQIEILRSLNCKEYVVVGDNDNAGEKFNEYLLKNLHDIGLPYYIKLPLNVKDVNMLSKNKFVKIYKNKSEYLLNIT